MTNIEKTNKFKILIEAIIPNSINKVLLVKIKVKKPTAVVALVSKVALPIF